MFRTIAVAVALTGATVASPVMAGETAEQVRGRVSLAGLDLSSPSGISALHDRIDRTAKKLCTRGVPDRLWSGPDVKACRASVVASGRVETARLVGGQPVDSRVATSY